MDDRDLIAACEKIASIKAANNGPSRLSKLMDAMRELRAGLATEFVGQAFSDLVLAVLRNRLRIVLESERVDDKFTTVRAKLVLLLEDSPAIDETNGEAIAVEEVDIYP